MIGADEFNVRKSQSTSRSTGDLSDMEYIETFLSIRGARETEHGYLIDIVCPQPRSQRPKGSAGKKSRASQSTANRGRK